MPLQLMRTSPYLSGQQRIDLELSLGPKVVNIDRIHVVPLSDNVLYNENEKRNAIQYSHSDNIKYLYSQTHQTFFDAIKNNKDTLLYNENEIDTYDHTYQRGMRRIRTERHDAQFSYLCPCWIDTEWGDDYAFRVTVKKDTYLQSVSKRIIKISDEFKKYMKDYLTDNSDEVMNINISRNQATIKGLGVENGISLTKNVNYLINDIMNRERPLIEFDSMLCNTFIKNRIIMKQLVNFNFIFDLEDVVNTLISGMMNGRRWNVIIEFGKYNNNNNVFTPFEMKDLYTNYQFIPKYRIDGNYSNENVLDYLSDNQCIDFIYANKSVQPICHWTLNDNQEYIYNFYNGFSPISNNNNEFASIGLYYGTPNLDIRDFNEMNNNCNWLRFVDNFNYSVLINYYQINGLNGFTRIPTRDFEKYWMEWLKFDTSNEELINIEDINTIAATTTDSRYNHFLPYEINDYNNNDPDVKNYENIYVLLCNCTSDINTNNMKYVTYTDGNNNTYNLWYIKEFIDNNFIYYLLINAQQSNDPLSINNMTALGCTSINFDSDNNNTDSWYWSDVRGRPWYCDDACIINYIINRMNYVVRPDKFIYDRGIMPVKANTNIANSNEIKYLKANKNSFTYLYRYTGHIMPMFIECNDDNILYNSEWVINTFSNVRESVAKKYNEGIRMKEKAVYPSIEYFPLSIIKDSGNENTQYTYLPDYYDVPFGNVHITSANRALEPCWFQCSLGYKIPKDIDLLIQGTQTNPMTLEMTRDALLDYFDSISATFNRDEFNRFIWPLYNYTYTFDYDSDTDINTINYKVKYKLR